TFKHPCPYCDRFIDRAVRACPFCGQVDPFAPRRCQNCRKVIDDPAWTVCPSCGQSLVVPAAAAADGTAAASPSTPTTTPATPPTSASAAGSAAAVEPPPPPRPPLDPRAALPVLESAGPCSGCGAPLPAGARFCTVCGTVAG
ncbi:MAG TPA: zinc-ribbon domain-containing protein, partial [Candidatus Limnocylindrales bacterium]